MDDIFSAKQVGQLSYMTDSLATLYIILHNAEIRVSNRAEYNPDTHKMQHYVSFSRNLTSAASRNSTRWKYGLIIDGDMLSNQYSIRPVSFAGQAISSQKLRVRSITLFDDNRAALTLVNWRQFYIPVSVYNEIKSQILSLPESDAQKMKLEVSGRGKQVRDGHTIEEKYLFNRKDGGIKISPKWMSDSSISSMLKHTVMNETEERIWTDSESFINIDGCIDGIVVPKSDSIKLYNEDDEFYPLILDELAVQAGPNFKVVTY